MMDFDEVTFDIGNAEILCHMAKEKPMTPFSESAIMFLEQLSETIRKHPEGKKMADVVSFGFWCRKNGILQNKRGYLGSLEGRLGKGISLHFVSSNIPVLFGFSMVMAILAGNCVVMRLSSKKSKQADIILSCLKEVLRLLPEWYSRIVILRYEHNKRVTDALTNMCDIRIIWGGDASVNEIRKSLLPPRAFEISFANRASAAIINASKVLEDADLSELIYGFYCDTYLNDQNACSSPGILYWIGTKERVEKARKKFWKAVFDYAKSRYRLEPSIVVKKWEQAACMSASFPNIHIVNNENLIVRAEVEGLMKNHWDYLTPGGFFIDAHGMDMKGLLPVLTQKCQTITCFGISQKEVLDFVIENRVKGVDRIVECGHALDFSFVWDGFDLITSMTRKISVMS